MCFSSVNSVNGAIVEAKLSEDKSEPEKAPEVNDENDPFKIEDNFDDEEVNK